ncbi:FCHO2 protein, partial [Eudromia elegans]|nr:FCHO2 protein [Eudromia elegans]
GEKNHGFDVLYHNMKHAQISTKELADFVRERYRGAGTRPASPPAPASPPDCPCAVPRATVEENYAKAMVKLSKMATNGTQLGTFAPLWEVFRISSDKLALCHLELMKKLHELLKEISRYGEEQGRVHKKSKEEVAGTLEAVQLLHGVAQLLPKSKESYHSKCQEYERLRKEGTSQKEIDKAELKSKKAGEALRRAVDKYNAARADFEQRMLDSAMRFQEVEEAHLRHMKGLIGSYSHSVEDTHVQIGQVHEEFKQNVENIGPELLLRRFAESKGTGRERPGEPEPGHCRGRSARMGLGGDPPPPQGVTGSTGGDEHHPEWLLQVCPEVDEDGFTVRPDVTHDILAHAGDAGPHACSSSDSDYDEEQPRRFRVHIKPVATRDTGAATAEAAVEQLKATVGNLILAPSLGVRRGAQRKVGGTLSPSTLTLFPSFSCRAPSPSGAAPCLGTELSLSLRPHCSPQLVPPPPSTQMRPSPGPARPPARCHSWPPPGAPAPRDPAPPSAATQTWCVGSAGGRGGLSRGPSPVVLGSQDALPVATAFTEYVHAYFKGRDGDSCLVKVTGELTMSFPAGMVRVLGASAAPPVLSFRLRNAGAIEHFMPNAELLYSDPSQSDPSTKDFWLNMAALTGNLQRQAEQSPVASYYNVALLKYQVSPGGDAGAGGTCVAAELLSPQFSKLGAGAAPLQLCVRWECAPDATHVTVEYGYNAGALAAPVPLANVQVLLPVEEPIANVRLQPAASWPGGCPCRGVRPCRGVPPTPAAPRSPLGCGRLSASWEPLCGPSKPSPVAAQFSSEGSTVSGVEVELAGAGYRMSLVKKRFATGTAAGR